MGIFVDPPSSLCRGARVCFLFFLLLGVHHVESKASAFVHSLSKRRLTRKGIFLAGSNGVLSAAFEEFEGEPRSNKRPSAFKHTRGERGASFGAGHRGGHTGAARGRVSSTEGGNDGLPRTVMAAAVAAHGQGRALVEREFEAAQMAEKMGKQTRVAAGRGPQSRALSAVTAKSAAASHPRHLDPVCVTHFVAECDMPTARGEFRMRGYKHVDSRGRASDIVVMVSGNLAGREAVPFRVHDQCMTSEVFGSRRCDCKEQLDLALDFVQKDGGAVVYLQQEGRGIGLANKIAAYALQDEGWDTVDANRKLGFEDDVRSYDAIPFIVNDLGVGSVRLMTNNPRKVRLLTDLGVRIAGTIPLLVAPSLHNWKYMHAKATRMHHMMPHLLDETAEVNGKGKGDASSEDEEEGEHGWGHHRDSTPAGHVLGHGQRRLKSFKVPSNTRHLVELKDDDEEETETSSEASDGGDSSSSSSASSTSASAPCRSYDEGCGGHESSSDNGGGWVKCGPSHSSSASVSSPSPCAAPAPRKESGGGGGLFSLGGGHRKVKEREESETLSRSRKGHTDAAALSTSLPVSHPWADLGPEEIKEASRSLRWRLGRKSVELALGELKKGGTVAVTDDESRENEGDLIQAAEHATPESMAFMIRHTSGILCVPMLRERVDLLEIPPMGIKNEDPRGTAFTVSVDLAFNTTTGISASDRAATCRHLASVAAVAGDFQRPGHVFPLIYTPGGVFRRGGHTEASVDLMFLAGLQPCAVIGEMISEKRPTEMARYDEMKALCQSHGVVMTTIEDMKCFIMEKHFGIKIPDGDL
uniref:GTP cyclohydrolase II n=1 Tax=Chromera velia CCMP2878 TaxID=1169474 RepID=A0A0G4G8S0_9ALVE|eukprot:Cvel_4363.t1-p1 / transcript=Cvel_4363.t1 / gene=Cvel_4363 / organism=Chromera_velia_CCMP2878 / gene_product=Riboflavin biosynthesis protein RibBA, putative / transcript_product=Riboflavin biosynthesis protein RibBA, putative / location=Cvel_scaffold189:34714-38319(-) / protein_length=810 / sequence_SO=supercontig / SO=protein_coding / is_pseudo=false